MRRKRTLHLNRIGWMGGWGWDENLFEHVQTLQTIAKLFDLDEGKTYTGANRCKRWKDKRRR